ncbi:MAG: 3-hydroxyacyl-CoA dehydrogenase NAD-binding domain-containing protein [Bryobacteraceae bacterium]|nr:3-hydroxyacyl-CoA dehydrogenase NAD-binding domain-containing protein [Bryobacteraceae bacterium]
MPEAVKEARRGNVLVLTIDNPPVNALSVEVLDALAAAVERAAADSAVEAVVLTGAGKNFIAGADISLFPRIAAGEMPPVPWQQYMNRIENCPKPAIAAIQGAALGGGLETAMACHWRIAARTAQAGQPEVKLGLIPGAGGTQRLPRLAGVEKAMEMCSYGDPLDAAEALAAGIFDQVVDGDPVEAAVQFALTGPAVRRTRDLQDRLCAPEQAESLAEVFRQGVRRRMPHQKAPEAAIEAVAAAARLPFEEGLAAERRLFEQCLRGEQSRALIHVFFAERAAAKAAGLPAPRPVGRAAVIGAGTMGAGIAVCFANAGIPVMLYDAAPEALERGLAGIRKQYEAAVKKGRMDEAEAARRMERIRPAEGLAEAAAEADAIVEAVFEDPEVKREVFCELDAAARPGALLATNTSTLDIDEIAAATKRPESVLGLHFFSPAPVMKLVEVVRGRATAPEAAATALELARRLKKIPVLAGNCFGFIGNRMFLPYRTQAVAIAEQGGAPEEIDAALTGWGMAMGPLAVGDLVGHDVWLMIRREALRRGVPHIPVSAFEDELPRLGRLGQKSGSGWYRYDENRRPQPDPELIRLLREYAAARGIEQRPWTVEQIRERTLLALVNEGARILDEGMAERASDIDVVFVHGFGFPAWRGGPMHWAEAQGKARVLARLEALYDEDGPFWKPAAWWR